MTMTDFDTLDVTPLELHVGDRIVQWPDSHRRSGRKLGTVKAIVYGPGGLLAYTMIYFEEGFSDRAPNDRLCVVHRRRTQNADESGAIDEMSIMIGAELDRLQASGAIEVAPGTYVGYDPRGRRRDVARNLASSVYRGMRRSVTGNDNRRNEIE